MADAAPNALIVVTGYPHLFETAPGDPTAALKNQINDATAASIAPSSKPSPMPRPLV